MIAAYGNVIRRPAPTAATSPRCRTNLVMEEAFKTVQLSGKTVMEGDSVVSVRITAGAGAAAAAAGAGAAVAGAGAGATAAAAGAGAAVAGAGAGAGASTFAVVAAAACKDSFCRCRRSAVEPLICNIASARQVLCIFRRQFFIVRSSVVQS